MSRSFLTLVAAVVATVPMLASDPNADKRDEKIDPAQLVGKWKSKSDYSKSLPAKVDLIYEFTKGGEMNIQIAPPDNPTAGTKRVEGSYKVNGKKLEMVWKVVENKEKEKVMKEIVKLTDVTLQLKHDNGKVEEFDRIKEKEKKDK